MIAHARTGASHFPLLSMPPILPAARFTRFQAVDRAVQPTTIRPRDPACSNGAPSISPGQGPGSRLICRSRSRAPNPEPLVDLPPLTWLTIPPTLTGLG